MALQGLMLFLTFQLMEFLNGKRLIFVKAAPWRDGDQLLGSKVVVQIFEDKTAYPRPEITNYGEQLTVKVRTSLPETFAQLRPMSTEVVIKDVERVTVYGEYRNQLSIIAKVSVKDAPAQ